MDDTRTTSFKEQVPSMAKIIELECIVGLFITEIPAPGSFITRCEKLRRNAGSALSYAGSKDRGLRQDLRILLKYEPHLKMSLEDVPAFLNGVGCQDCVPLIGHIPWCCLLEWKRSTFRDRGLSMTRAQAKWLQSLFGSIRGSYAGNLL